MTDQDPAVQRRRLRFELRRARDAAGLKQAEVARAMDWSPSKLIRIERGDVSVSTNDLKVLLSHYGVKDHVKVNRLLDLARSARGASFYDQYADLLKPGFKEYLAYEASASVLRQYDPVYVPGVLQTEEYARGMFEGMSRADQVTADRGWAIRQHRQEVHERESPMEMLFVLDEAALRRQVGRGQSMRYQLERIKEYATKPNISIQIMPFTHGAHPGMYGNFNILEFADPNLDDLVYLETVESVTIRNDIELIAQYLDRFGQLQEMALSPEDSADFLDGLIRDMSPPRQTTNSTEKEAV
ncbi:MAG: helix-turn-helix domain-containing protein [Pseudonocardiales bacterium]